MTIDNVLEILEKHKLRIPSNVFYELKADIVNFEEPTTKNDLGVDCISRQAVLDAIDSKAWEFCDYLISKGRNDEQKPVSHFADNLRECVREELPSVTPQEPQIFKWCDTCKEYDQEKHCCHRWSKVIRDTVEEMKQEQEPMVEIDLYSVIKQKYIEREVLDKIRAEIIELRSKQNVGVLECLDIIDKYKGESEVEDGECK